MIIPGIVFFIPNCRRVAHNKYYTDDFGLHTQIPGIHDAIYYLFNLHFHSEEN